MTVIPLADASGNGKRSCS